MLERVVKELKLEEPRSIQAPGIAGLIRTVARSLIGRLQALLKLTGLIRTLSFEETFNAAVDRLRSQLVVEPAIDSQIIWIRYRDPDPVLASKVVNKVAEEYQYQHLSININRAENSFYAEQIEKVEKELKGLQEQLPGLRKESGIVSYSEQRKSLLKKLETYDNALTNGRKEIIRIRAKVDLLLPLGFSLLFLPMRARIKSFLLAASFPRSWPY